LKRKLLQQVVVCLLLFGTYGHIEGQDLHYSQFYHSPQNINPALTGIFNGDLRFSGNFRDQWRSVPVPYTTYTGAFDMKIFPKRSDKSFFGFGVVFNYDLMGTPSLNTLHLGLSGSYTYMLNNNNLLTGGVQIGGAQKAFKTDLLTWDRQWNGFQYDPTLQSGENFDNLSVLFADISLGANYRLQANDQRSKIDFGAGYYHLNRPNQNFYDDLESRLPQRLAIHAIGALKVSENVDVLLHGVYQIQAQSSEIVPGAGAKIYLNQQRGKELALVLGANWRVQDAVIPTIELHYKTWHAGFSYDINYSDFNVATGRRGGPELSLSYRILKVKPLPVYKTCPIY
jgi:type IX secretion system PorP/SprF family membrane protein